MGNAPVSRAWVVFFTSMLPLFENKGSILLAVTLKLTWYQAFFFTTIGDFIPVAFFLHNKERWLKKLHDVSWVNKSLIKVNGFLDKHKFSTKNSAVMLAIIICIPFTGIGGWVGCVLSDVLNIDKKHAAVAILVGIAVSGAMTVAALYGLVAAGRAIMH